MTDKNEDAIRLEFISKNIMYRDAPYALFVLQRGGTGDLSDIRAYVDIMMKKETP